MRPMTAMTAMPPRMRAPTWPLESRCGGGTGAGRNGGKRRWGQGVVRGAAVGERFAAAGAGDALAGSGAGRRGGRGVAVGTGKNVGRHGTAFAGRQEVGVAHCSGCSPFRALPRRRMTCGAAARARNGKLPYRPRDLAKHVGSRMSAAWASLAASCVRPAEHASSYALSSSAIALAWPWSARAVASHSSAAAFVALVQQGASMRVTPVCCSAGRGPQSRTRGSKASPRG